MELGLVRKVDIDREMQQSYLDYAMSVIVARALPDARDGLKPVQRRILYAMYDMGLRAGSSYKKSARIVGEVLGKYHPHGDMAVYDAMARMAQDFSMRYQLVDGQGNFGSIDGDPPAAMRYTEARLPASAMEMLVQLEKDTVNFLPNFDETLSEPEVLPAAIPNLLVNGATGIAVGMATNIPPHNLIEVVDACIFLLQRWDKLEDIAVDELMKFIKGPDFPTGGVIIHDPQSEGLAGAYGSGRGRITVQARAHLEESGRGRTRIIVTELPYMTNKSSLIERIAELARDGSVEGLTDLRDESDRQGMRILIELSKTADPEKILRELYKRTPMQSTFGINLLALVNGEPRLLNLKQALKVYLEHRLEVVRRRSEYDLDKARQRAHILEGLRIALKNLDEIINIIRNAKDVEDARQKLIKRYKLSDIQATAILDMPLRRLAALERKKIEIEYKEVMALIKDLETLLKSPQKMREVISDELNAVKTAYGDRRRTQIVSLKEGESIKALLTTTDVTPAEAVWVAMMEDGTIMRTNDDTVPRMSGRDEPSWLVHTNTHHTLYVVGQDGISTAIPVHALPFADKPADGVHVAKISPLDDSFIPAALFSLPPDKDEGVEVYALSVTRGGMVKKTAVADLPGPSSNTFTMVKVNSGDALGWMVLTQGKQEILLCTAQGMAIRFSEEDVRSMGMVAAGVNGIKLAVGDEVVGAEVLQGGEEVFLITSDGKAKRVALKDFPIQGRYGQGVIAWKLSKGARVVGMTAGKGTSRCIIHLARAASKSMRLDEAVLQGRSTQGQSVVDVRTGDAVLSLTAPLDVLMLWNKSNTPKPAPKTRKKVVQGPTQAELFTSVDEDTGSNETPKTRSDSSRRSTTKKTSTAPAQKTTRSSGVTTSEKPASNTTKRRTTSEKPASSTSKRIQPKTKPKTGQ